VLTASAELLCRRQLVPRETVQLVCELKTRPADSETLVWAAGVLRAAAIRRQVLKTDERFGLLCCSAGIEGFVFLLTFIFFGAFSTIFLAPRFGGDRAAVSVTVALATFVMASLVVASIGIWSRGGLVFRLVGVDVLRRDGRPASRARCALRSIFAWSPQLFLYSGFLALVHWSATTWPHTAAVPDGKLHLQGTPGTELWQTIGLFCSLGVFAVLQFAGICWALARPQRGLQDVLVGTYLAPR
jgi:hypothetical protein